MTEGIAIVFGDDVNTDLLHPSYFFSLDTTRVRDGFLGAVESTADRGIDRARIIVAGKNFGCGSSRETTMTALRLAGVQAVVAESFGRIFFRNAMSLGVPALTAASLDGFAAAGDQLRITDGMLHNLTQHREAALQTLDPMWAEVLEAGGMIAFLRNRGAL